MVPGLADAPTPGPAPVTCFVVAAASALGWLIATGQVELRSPAGVELLLMLLFITWIGVLRPSRASRRQNQG